VKTLVANNDFIRIRLLHAGAKVLAKQDKGEVQFRILDEGLETMLPYINEKRIVQGNFDDLKPLLREQYPFFNKLPERDFRYTIEKYGIV
jgi:multisite-specific tRNA:(cytosine-C5)-methyltransferase